VTPHVLTETSNWLGYLQDPLKRACFATLAEWVPQWHEHQAAATALVQEEVFLRLGLTASAIIQASAANVTVLTDDLDLYVAAVGAGRDSINFTHRREDRGLV
jgi:predicted RNA-binding Zn ribbon-like protein